MDNLTNIFTKPTRVTVNLDLKGKLSFIGASLIVLSVSLLDKTNSNLGHLLFSVGWILVGVSVGLKNNKFVLMSALPIVASVLVLVSAYYTRTSMNEDYKRYASLGFYVGWGLLVLSIYLSDQNISRTILASIGGLSVLIAMKGIIPRQTGIQGIGMPLFTLGWTLVPLAVSMA